LRRIKGGFSTLFSWDCIFCENGAAEGRRALDRAPPETNGESRSNPVRSQRKPRRFPAVLAAFFLLLACQAAHAGERFTPGVPYYFDTFDPAQKPWKPGQDLNYEEVFKNHLFYEIVFSPSGSEMTVNRYIRNNKTDSEQYRLNPDGSLSRAPGGP
jgi:hypothetical protein